MSSTAFTKDKIVDYWKKFFPEIDKEEFEKIVDFGGKVTFDELIRKYNDYDSTEEFELSDHVDFDFCAPCVEAYNNMDDKGRFYGSVVLPIANKHFRGFFEKCMGYDFIKHDSFLSESLTSFFNNAVNIIIKPFLYEFGYLSKNGSLDSAEITDKKKYFTEVYSRDRSNMEKFYKEYAAVTALASGKIEEECRYRIEILDNILSRKEDIKKVFGIDMDNDPVSYIKTSSGDTHQKGKTVGEVVFESGKHFMYKPHQLKIDLGFRELLDWMKSEDPQMHDHITPDIITDENFGFAGYVEHNECKDEAEVERFYQRSGELLAVLHSMNGSDMHFENIISNGEYPILIDLETLLHPTLDNKESKKDTSAKAAAAKKYSSSVLNVGMLPMYLGGGLDIGGFSAAESQKAGQKSDVIVDEDSDNIHIERTYSVLEPQKNNPVLDGKNVEASKYVSSICKGFSEVYKWISENKAAYTAKIREIFTGLIGRIVIRPTNTYAQLLAIAQDQAFSRKDYERSLIMHRIFIDAYKQNKTVALTEYDALMNGDVPYFIFKIGDNRLYNEDGAISDEDMITPLLESIEEKINGFSSKALDEQVNYIKGSFVKRRDEAELTGLNFMSHVTDTDKWLETAENIGGMLMDNAIKGCSAKGRTDAAWNCVTVDSFEEDKWIPSVMASDLYSGNSGVVLFLSQLGKVTGKKEYLDYAEYAMNTVAEDYDTLMDVKNPPIGAFSGLSGAAYTAAHLGRASGNKEWFGYAEKYLAKCADAAAEDKNYDYIAGAAGVIPVALSMKDVYADKKQELDSIIEKLADSLVSSVGYENGLPVWEIESDKKKQCYTGFAHGNAGIHSGLYLAGRYLGTDKYDEIVKGSVERERAHYIKVAEGWERSDTDHATQHAWCHGSAGILLSKLLMAREGYTDEKLGLEIRKAINSVGKYGFGYGPNYCHGDFGNLAVLDLAARQLNDMKLKNTVFNSFSSLYNDQLEANWNTTKFKGCMNYGIMLGLSGWGYAMLSHYTDFEIPQLLWLE